MTVSDSTDTPVNLAILIGVCDYTSITPLPGCRGDIEIMSKIIEGVDKFEAPLKICGSIRSQAAKSQLAEFIDRNSKKKVGEVFFYYSGHGTASSDDFLFLFSDYDDRLINQTTLSNKELDGMLKALNPQLTVKVIDACRSGVSYVKDPDVISVTLEKSKAQFNKCYFMFSSQSYESSWQDKDTSVFTSEFKNAVVKGSSNRMRYKDIIDSISDAFQISKLQTPFFVTQADFTEVFCQNPSKLQLLFGVITGEQTVTAPLSHPEAEGKGALLDLVKKDANRYCKKEEIAAEINHIEQRALNLTQSTEIESLYLVSVEHQDAAKLPNIKAIADWFEKKETEFFVGFTTESVEYQAYVDPPPVSTRTVSAFSYSRSQFEAMYGGLLPVTQVLKKMTKEIVSGVYPTVDVGYQALVATITPHYPNLTAWQLCIFPVFSRVHIRLFYCFARMVEQGWDDRKPPSNVEWKTRQEEIKSGKVPQMMDSIAKEFVEVVTKQITERLTKDTTKDTTKETKDTKDTTKETKKTPRA